MPQPTSKKTRPSQTNHCGRRRLPAPVLALRVIKVPRQTPLRELDARTGLSTKAGASLAEAIADLPAVPEPSKRPVAQTTSEIIIEPAHDIGVGLVDETVRHRADLLVLGWHGGFSLGRISDSPVRRVVGGLPADFAVLNDRGLADLNRILLPWGGGPHARLGLELALRIAGATGGQVDLLRAVRESVSPEQEAATVRKAIEPLASQVDTPIQVLVRPSEDVVSTIVGTAREGDYDLLIIGASGEAGLRTVLFGTIPDIVADRAPCSVLLVRRYVPGHWAYRTSEGFKRLREWVGLTSSAE